MLNDKEKLSNIIEGILFVSGQGVEIADIAEKLEIEKKQVEKAIEQLKQKHENDGINIITYKTSVQMCSNPIFAEEIAAVSSAAFVNCFSLIGFKTVAISSANIGFEHI